MPIILSHRPDDWRVLAGAYLAPPLLGAALRYGLVGPLLRRHRLQQVGTCVSVPKYECVHFQVRRGNKLRCGLVGPLLRWHRLQNVGGCVWIYWNALHAVKSAALLSASCEGRTAAVQGLGVGTSPSPIFRTRDEGTRAWPEAGDC